VLGVSLEDNSPATGHSVTLFAALGLIATVMILGTFWARFANRDRT
jgi:LPXTG-motif cell wall-anchored protein